jgi:hypothetical protein
MSSLTTVLTVLVSIWTALGLLALVPGSGVDTDPGLDGHVCTTISDPVDGLEDPDVPILGRDGLVRAVYEEAVCRPDADLDHPRLTAALSDATGLPFSVVALGLLLALRRVITGTRDVGPFDQETVRRLRRLRVWAIVAVFAAVNVSWALHGVTNHLVAGTGWPDLDFVGPVLATAVIGFGLVGVCEFGAGQRQDAYERGRADEQQETPGPIA